MNKVRLVSAVVLFVIAASVAGAQAGEWVYLKELYPNYEYSGAWYGPRVNFGGQAYAYSYASKVTLKPEGSFQLANLRHPGKPKKMEVTLAVQDETKPEQAWRFYVTVDCGPTICVPVSCRVYKKLLLDVNGAGRVDFKAVQTKGPFFELGGPVLIEPRLLY